MRLFMRHDMGLLHVSAVEDSGDAMDATFRCAHTGLGCYPYIRCPLGCSVTLVVCHGCLCVFWNRCLHSNNQKPTQALLGQLPLRRVMPAVWLL